jgi:histidyl-tRNA synthetase
MRIIDCKNPECKAQIEGMPKTTDYLCSDCKEHFEKTKEYLTAAGILFSVDHGIVRGLDYYNRTVFEFVTSEIGAQGTGCGGGRYDTLTEQIGGQRYAGIGFAMGLERLLLLMEAQKVAIPEPDGVKLFLIPAGKEAEIPVLKLLYSLRGQGITAEGDLLSRSIKAQMKTADRLGAKYTAVLGESEISSGILNVKNMESGESFRCLSISFVEAF